MSRPGAWKGVRTWVNFRDRHGGSPESNVANRNPFNSRGILLSTRHIVHHRGSPRPDSNWGGGGDRGWFGDLLTAAGGIFLLIVYIIPIAITLGVAGLACLSW